MSQSPFAPSLTAEQHKVYQRYAALALPRHTSYPSALNWSSEVGQQDLDAAILRSERASLGEGKPVSLYVHVPFCEKLCYYCGCNKLVIDKKNSESSHFVETYLAALLTEADRMLGTLTAANGGHRPDIAQVHFGGGTPTYLTPEQIEMVWRFIFARATLLPDAEVAAEIDPRVTTREHLERMRALGFNRLSLGVQDFDPRVQAAVNRVQPFELVERKVAEARSLGFTSINFDLIYGLPFQTRASAEGTMAQVLGLSPDRIAYYRLALLPEIFKWQRLFGPQDLPSAAELLEMNLYTVGVLTEGGYEFIGLDHFARPTEALAKARVDGTLKRSFQGMTTAPCSTLIGLGPSAISMTKDFYGQSHADFHRWRRAVGEGACHRGWRLTLDDRIRRSVIEQIYCHRMLDKAQLERDFGIVFDEYFQSELEKIAALTSDGLLEVSADGCKLHATEPLGVLLLRVIASVFDAYLPPDAYRLGLAKGKASTVG